MQNTAGTSVTLDRYGEANLKPIMKYTELRARRLLVIFLFLYFLEFLKMLEILLSSFYKYGNGK